MGRGRDGEGGREGGKEKEREREKESEKGVHDVSSVS